MRGAEAVAGVEVRVMGALERIEVVRVAAEHVGGRGQQLEVRRRARGAGQGCEGVGPGPPRVELAAPFGFGDGIHDGVPTASHRALSASPMIAAVVVAPATKPKNGPKSRVDGKPGM